MDIVLAVYKTSGRSHKQCHNICPTSHQNVTHLIDHRKSASSNLYTYHSICIGNKVVFRDNTNVVRNFEQLFYKILELIGLYEATAVCVKLFPDLHEKSKNNLKLDNINNMLIKIKVCLEKYFIQHHQCQYRLKSKYRLRKLLR